MLGNIFNDIIDMDKMECCKVQFDNQLVDFISFFVDFENLFGLQVQQKGLCFVLELSLLLLYKVIMDGICLWQILWNFISNVVKFILQGGGVNVCVCYDEGDILYFEVEDFGIGIFEVEQDKIFVMYYQVKDSYGGKLVIGIGIGFVVLCCLVCNMGGDISVISQLGKGVIFMFIVYVFVIVEEVEDMLVEDDMLLLVFNVLLVEDIEFNVIVVCLVLEKLGNSVDVVMIGKVVLEMFESGEYDFVLLDIQLLDMIGLDIFWELKQCFVVDELLLLVVFIVNVLKNKKEYFDVGMDDVLSKLLLVLVLMVMIKKFWDVLDEEVQEVLVVDLYKVDVVLDIDMLE